MLEADHGTTPLWDPVVQAVQGGHQLAAPRSLVDNTKPIFRTSVPLQKFITLLSCQEK